MKFQVFLAQHVVVIITLIQFGRISSILDTSISSDVYATCVEKYVAKSYFSKHDKLVDSKFEDFIAHNILSRTCCESLQDNVKFAPKLSTLNMKLAGEGSHRRLSSSLRLKMSSESISRPPKSCEVVIIERLPSGVFADPFELQHFIQRGVFKDAAVFGDTNLELPSFQSNRSVVEVHLEMGSNLSEQKDELEIHMELPLHARYQPLGHGFSRVEFAAPDLFLRCNIEGKQHNTSCLFLLDKQSSESNDGHLVWEIPCGSREHTEIVSALTFFSAVVSAALIIFASIKYSGDTACKDLKQS